MALGEFLQVWEFRCVWLFVTFSFVNLHILPNFHKIYVKRKHFFLRVSLNFLKKNWKNSFFFNLQYVSIFWFAVNYCNYFIGTSAHGLCLNRSLHCMEKIFHVKLKQLEKQVLPTKVFLSMQMKSLVTCFNLMMST